MAAYRSASVQVKGLADLQRAFKRMSGDLDRQVKERLRKIAGEVATDARQKLRARSKNPAGRIERTGRPFVRQRAAGVRFTHPGAAVIQWGGTIRPRGTPIKIKGKSFATDAAEEHMDATERELGEMLDDLARGAGGFS